MDNALLKKIKKVKERIDSAKLEKKFAQAELDKIEKELKLKGYDIKQIPAILEEKKKELLKLEEEIEIRLKEIDNAFNKPDTE